MSSPVKMERFMDPALNLDNIVSSTRRRTQRLVSDIPPDPPKRSPSPTKRPRLRTVKEANEKLQLQSQLDPMSSDSSLSPVGPLSPDRSSVIEAHASNTVRERTASPEKIHSSTPTHRKVSTTYTKKKRVKNYPRNSDFEVTSSAVASLTEESKPVVDSVVMGHAGNIPNEEETKTRSHHTPGRSRNDAPELSVIVENTVPSKREYRYSRKSKTGVQKKASSVEETNYKDEEGISRAEDIHLASLEMPNRVREEFVGNSLSMRTRHRSSETFKPVKVLRSQPKRGNADTLPIPVDPTSNIPEALIVASEPPGIPSEIELHQSLERASEKSALGRPTNDAPANDIFLQKLHQSPERQSNEPAPNFLTNDEPANTKSTDISFQTLHQSAERQADEPASNFLINDEAANRIDMAAINPFNILEMETSSWPNLDPAHALLESFEEQAEDDSAKSNLTSQESSAYDFQTLDLPIPLANVEIGTLETARFQNIIEALEHNPDVTPSDEKEPMMVNYQEPPNCEFDSDVVSPAELLSRHEDIEILETLESHEDLEISAIPASSWRELEEEMEALHSASQMKDYMEGIEVAGELDRDSAGEGDHDSPVSSVVQSSRASSIEPDSSSFVQPDMNSSDEDIRQQSPVHTARAFPPHIPSEQENHGSPPPTSPISQYSPKSAMNGSKSPLGDATAVKSPNRNTTEFNKSTSPVRNSKRNNRETCPEVIEMCSLHEIPAVTTKPKRTCTPAIHEWVQPYSQPHPHCTFRIYLPRNAPTSVRDQFCILCGGDLCGPMFTGMDGYLQTNTIHKCIVDENYKLVKVMLATVLVCEECGSLVGEFGECVADEGDSDDNVESTRRVCRGYGKGERDADVRMLRARFLTSLYQERDKKSM
ncbi:hypothetical protein BJ741DRAFT_708630 [Chytriomyces cf. hyalinus JEL632]|nr:hypothetical protein BJ741DRAFT_708630 [Chytriomyces cf. hyalinus JEL632]